MSGKKFETQVAILAATLLCELGRVVDPRLSKFSSPPKNPGFLRPLTFREARQVLEQYGVRTTGQ